MIKISDYNTPDGKTDWTAYDNARKDSGEACYKCGSYILFGKGYRSMCDPCSKLRSYSNRDEVYQNTKGIRCPKCRHVMDDPYDIGADIYQEGTHDITCNSCDHEFEIETHVEYSWTSPAMIEEVLEDEDDEDNEKEEDDEVDD